MAFHGSLWGLRLGITNKHFTLDDLLEMYAEAVRQGWYCLGCGELIDLKEAYEGNDEIGFYCSKKCLEERYE